MGKLITALLLVLNLCSYSQTLQQQIDQLKVSQRLDSIRLVKLTLKVEGGQRADSLRFERQYYQIRTLKNSDSLNNIKVRSLSNYVLGLRADSIKKTFQISSLQRQDSLFKIENTTQNSRIRSLELDSMYQAAQILKLQQINTLGAVGSLKLVKTGTLAYELRQDSATKLKDGNLTAFTWRQIQTIYKKVFPVTSTPPAPENPPTTIPPISTQPIPSRTITHPKFFPNLQ